MLHSIFAIAFLHVFDCPSLQSIANAKTVAECVASNNDWGFNGNKGQVMCHFLFPIFVLNGAMWHECLHCFLPAWFGAGAVMKQKLEHSNTQIVI